MRIHIFVCLFLVVFCQVLTQETVLNQIRQLYRLVRKVIAAFCAFYKKSDTSDTLKKKIQNKIPDSFPCNVSGFRSAQKPTSVHKLKPGDIDVVAALGDSITAGVGITAISFSELLEEERGKAFSIGGEETWREFLTLPNILKMFNPNLKGYAKQSALSFEDASELNVAELCSVSSDMPYMAQQLISRIKLNSQINLLEDWKMITILIGFNDFCAHICYYTNTDEYIEKHRNDMIETFRILRDNLPRTIINFVLPSNLKILIEAKLVNRTLCDFFRIFACPCLVGLPNLDKKPLYFDLMHKWQDVDEEVAYLDEFNTDDFTIVLQPFFLNYTMPQTEPGVTDLDFLSGDCFHWSQKTHAKVANELWNNMLEPVGNKSTSGIDLFSRFLCPTEEDPYIYTRNNSNLNSR